MDKKCRQKLSHKNYSTYVDASSPPDAAFHRRHLPYPATTNLKACLPQHAFLCFQRRAAADQFLWVSTAGLYH
jgi:hypothetical protein